MIKHIVLFKLEGKNKLEFMKEIKLELENLLGKIEELKTMEVGISYLEDNDMPDLSLISSFEDKEGLAIYQKHPEHVKIGKKLRARMAGRSVVDYTY